MSHCVITLGTAAAALALATGCSNDRIISPPLGSSEQITVSAGLHPLIAWTPGGAVYSVTVSQAGSGPIMWAARSPGSDNAIRPSVEYGTTPQGAIATANAIFPLAAGTRYRVDLLRADSLGAPHVIATSFFRP